MKTFTTGQVAKICKVAPRTVSKWFDSGRLRGYRVPGSQDRRIPREYLVRFLNEQGMPLGQLANEISARALVVSPPEVDLGAVLKAELRGRANWELRAAPCGFSAGLDYYEFEPNVLVVDFRGSGAESARALLADLQRRDGHKPKRTIVVIPSNLANSVAELPTLAREFFEEPFDVEQLVQRILSVNADSVNALQGEGA